MRVYKRIIILIVLFLHLPIAECFSSNRAFFSIRDGKTISHEEMKNEIINARIIIIGENHSNRLHHDFQLQILETLHSERIPIAIGLEMFRADSQGALDEWVKGTLSLQDFLEVYYDNWSFSWDLYKDIFLYARDNKIPMVGLNISRNITKKIAQYGFSSLTDEELEYLPQGITCSITSAYKEFIKRVYKGHDFVNEKIFDNFCEAQMVWDSTMAWNVMKYMKKNPARVMVVLTGTGHAWKMGLPSKLQRDPRFSYIVLLPEKPGSIDRRNITIKEADYLILQ